MVNEKPATNQPQQREVVISIKDLHKSYGPKEVLKGIDLDVYAGELFGFIGKNGVGKSTTIDCVIGAKKFNQGEITLNGYDIIQEPIEAKYSYGYVASEPSCYESMTGYDYLEFVASIYGITEGDFVRNYKYLCTRLSLDLKELANPVSDYSHGMKQKLCLAASLLHNPKIWVLDEPTVGLDIMAVEELKRMMREYANHGKTVFVTSHNIDLVAKLCDRVCIINKGKIAALYDLNREPNRRIQLAKIFMDIYKN
ncbi:MAG: ABC transporter ATP-binding protein [Clostridia bacterium]|nr:ABC transporter ATP-binding protein [Clostridia bacterium]